MPDKPTVSYDEFAKLDLRVAKVVTVREHPNADKLLLLEIDLGPLGSRQIVAGIRPYYPDPQSLVGTEIVVIANLEPRTVRGQTSNGMLLAASSDDRSQVIVLTTEQPIAPGSAIS